MGKISCPKSEIFESRFPEKKEVSRKNYSNSFHTAKSPIYSESRRSQLYDDILDLECVL